MSPDQSESIRSFLAIELSDALKAEVRSFVEKIKERYPDFRFTQSESWHLTLHFFGELNTGQIDRLKVRLAPVIQNLSPFIISLAGFGAFPSFRNPSILWLGVSTRTDELNVLKLKVDQALREVHFSIENRAFKPHLTIARRKSRTSLPSISLPADIFSPKAEQEVRHVTLFQSILTPSGAHYRPLCVFPLSAGFPS